MPDDLFARSRQFSQDAKQVIAGGVASTLRAVARPHPLYFERGEGAYLWDVDGNRYVDFALGYGPLILGHAPDVLRRALHEQVDRGHTFGSQHRLEIEVASLLTTLVPGAEQAVFSSTGSEAVAVAMRIARACTGRTKVVKFEGHYHGWLDGIFASVAVDPATAGPPQRPRTVAQTSGTSPGALEDLLVAPWNDLDAARLLFEAHHDNIAALILEPLPVNGGVIPPLPGFLDGLRELTRANGSLLIFDEVITGFRLGLGGAQEHYGVTADLAVFAKAMGGGVAISAVTGPRAVMDVVASGRVAHRGTFNANPLACAAAAATLGYLRDHAGEIYPRLFQLGESLAEGLRSASPRLTVRSVGPVVYAAIGEPANVTNVRQRVGADAEANDRFVEALLPHGIHTTHRGLWYLSTAHEQEDVALAVEAAGAVLSHESHAGDPPRRHSRDGISGNGDGRWSPSSGSRP